MINIVKQTALTLLLAGLFVPAEAANDPVSMNKHLQVQQAQSNQSINTVLDEKWSSDDIVAVDQDVPATASFITQTFPRLEVRTNKDYVKVIAELPGVQQKDLELTCNSDILCLAGKRQEPSAERVIVSELPTGTFKRRVRLPHPVKVEKSTASLKDGILTVTMPRWQTAESPKKISISTNERGYQSCALQSCNRF